MAARSDDYSLERFRDMAGLLDSYGACLTGHQRLAMELYYMSDCSLAEIAEELGISRQGAHELIRRSGEKLTALEEKLGLVKKTAQMREACLRLKAAAEALESGADSDPQLRELIDAAHSVCETEGMQ